MQLEGPLRGRNTRFQYGSQRVDKDHMQWLSIVMVLLALQAPVLTVSPESGQPATEFVVSGSGFEPGERVKIFWDGVNQGGTVRVDADGMFRYSGVVPDGASLGAHTIEANAIGGGANRAQTSFTVTSASTTTSSTVTSTTSSTVTSTTSPSVTSTTSSGTTTPTSAAAATASTTADVAKPEANPVSSPVADAFGSTVTDGGVSPVGEPSQSSGEGPVGTSAVTPSSTSTSVADDSEETGDATPVEESGGFAGLVIVLTVLSSVAGVTFFLWGRSRRSEERAADRLPAEEAPALRPVSAADVDARDGEWVRRMMDLSPEGEITALVTSSVGLIGLGRALDTRAGREEAAVWTSDDGVVWRGAGTLGTYGALVAVPWLGGMMVTISDEVGGHMRTSCWRSGDGESWEQLTDPSGVSLAGVSLEGGTALDGIVVAWGRTRDAPGVWFTEDGVDWHRSELLGDFDLIARDGDALLAFGRDLAERRPLVARSVEGTSWDELEDRQSRTVFTGASVAALEPFQGGMVVAGTDVTRGSGAVWVSDDWTRWHRVPFEPGPGTSIDRLFSAGDRLIATGTDSGRSRGGRGTPIIWESYDAVSWQQVALPEILSDAVVDSISLQDDSMLICGTLPDERDGADHASIPVSWRWDLNRDPEPDSESHHKPSDASGEQILEMALGVGARQV